MGAAQNLEHDGIYISADEWQEMKEAILMIREIREILSKQPKTVGTAEAGVILGKSARTIRQWHKLGKMPKPVSKDDENLAWERSAIEKMCTNKAKGGRPRSTT